MASPTDPPHVQPIAALLYRERAVVEEALDRLAAAFSPVEWVGEPHPFDQTDYYAPEMGIGLQRVLAAFERLEPPGWLVRAKLAAAVVEDELRMKGRRRVNIDVGYLDLGKVVLASFKERPTKLYLDAGVWADLTLTYSDGAWHPLPWSFPDFRDGRYDAELHIVRSRYKARLRALEQGSGGRDTRPAGHEQE